MSPRAVAKLAAVALGALLGLCACEDNEHPFGDAWGMSCFAEGAPGMTAYFLDPKHLDDGGNRREYLGRVEVAATDFPDVWLWQIEVDLAESTAQTVAMEHVAVPEDYVTGEPFFQHLGLQVETYVEAPDTTSAEMTGTCRYGDARGDLYMSQSDDCDLCIDCDTGGTPASAAGIGAALLLLLGRRSRARRPVTPAPR